MGQQWARTHPGHAWREYQRPVEGLKQPRTIAGQLLEGIDRYGWWSLEGVVIDKVVEGVGPVGDELARQPVEDQAVARCQFPGRDDRVVCMTQQFWSAPPSQTRGVAGVGSRIAAVGDSVDWWSQGVCSAGVVHCTVWQSLRCRLSIPWHCAGKVSASTRARSLLSSASAGNRSSAGRQFGEIKS